MNDKRRAASRKKEPTVDEAGSAQPLSAMAYAIIALSGLILAGGFTVFYIYKVPKLVESGTQGQIFYLLLIPWALSCAAFLFGAMRAYARLTYKHLGTALELGGPVVLFCLVLIGGFKLVPPPPPTFDLAVRAHSSDTPLITKGQVTLELPGLPHANIGPDGEANFKGISAQYKGKPIRVLPQIDGYEQQWLTPTVEGDTLDLTLEKEHPVTTLTGSLLPAPAAGKKVKVTVDGQDADTSPDELGRFKLAVNGKPGDRVRIRVYQDGKVIYDDYQILPGPVTLPLR